MRNRGEPLSNLVCGNLNSQYSYSKELVEVESALHKKITFFCSKLLSCNFSTYESRMFAPFYARNILEATATALLARIDPFRAIITYKVQNDSSYTVEAPSKVAISWSGDILAESHPKQNLWDFENKLSDFSRSLFSKYQGEIIWKPSFLEAADYIDLHALQSLWISEMLNNDEKQFFEQTRQRAKSLFSSFSKGVHSESLVNTTLIYDEVTLRTFSLDLLKCCCMLGLLSHFSPYILLPYKHRTAFIQFNHAEEVITNALQ